MSVKVESVHKVSVKPGSQSSGFGQSAGRGAHLPAVETGSQWEISGWGRFFSLRVRAGTFSRCFVNPPLETKQANSPISLQEAIQIPFFHASALPPSFLLTVK